MLAPVSDALPASIIAGVDLNQRSITSCPALPAGGHVAELVIADMCGMVLIFCVRPAEGGGGSQRFATS